MEEPHGSSGTAQQVAGGPPTIAVADTTQLMNALKPGVTIHLKAKTYTVDKTLVIPDGATLQGAGRDAV